MTAEQPHDSYAEHSTVVGLASAAANQLQSWIVASWLIGITTTLGRRFDDATRTSRLAATLRTLEHWLRASYCYRWLTAEPDPDVIVIDLRETYAVGPFIALLDRIRPSVERTWYGSRTHNASATLRTSSKRRWIANAQSIQLLAAALEPPEPPEERRD